MFKNSFVAGLSLVILHSVAAAADGQPQAKLSAEEIVGKNAAARGGLEAWRAVQTMTLSGKLGAGGNQRATLNVPSTNVPAPRGRGASVNAMVAPRPVDEVQLPFVMELKRPRKMRFELQFSGQTAVQVFDGLNGWKLRPYLNRRMVEPYTADEMKQASAQADLDGPLMDYQAKGTKVELAGAEKVEGRDTYKIKLTKKNGETQHVWIDAGTFLETKIEGQPRVLDGVAHPVEVYFRDYRAVSGLQIPFVLETKVLSVGKTVMGLKDPAVPPEKVVIDRVVVNPQLADSLFAKPEVEVASTSR